jgi:hypothetical protein
MDLRFAPYMIRTVIIKLACMEGYWGIRHHGIPPRGGEHGIDHRACVFFFFIFFFTQTGRRNSTEIYLFFFFVAAQQKRVWVGRGSSVRTKFRRSAGKNAAALDWQNPSVGVGSRSTCDATTEGVCVCVCVCVRCE